MMNPSVRIVKSTTEYCPQAGKDCMTLYFEDAPTIKQIMRTAKVLRMGHRIKPNLDSRSLRVFTNADNDLVRCQIAD